MTHDQAPVWVPTTEEVRGAYADGAGTDEERRLAQAGFYAWLDEVRADERRKALTEAADRLARDWSGHAVSTWDMARWLRTRAAEVTR